jgi:hypothetical protein
LIATAFAAVLLAAPAHADVITDWNAKGEAVTIEKQDTPPVAARSMALLQVAMFEAVNAIDRRYTGYKLDLAAAKSASKEAAAAAAAHDVLLALYPDQRANLDAALATSLAAIAPGEPKEKGIALGQKAAAEMMALRAGDAADAPETYRPHTNAGVYVPTPIPLATNTGAVRPWTMTSGSQFRPAPPPALDSETWTADLNEIRLLGARNSAVRTPEQTAIGRFWFAVGPRTWNPMVRQIAAAKDMDLVDCARLFALIAMAGHDALIAVFDAKYTYNLWRPITAIRNADITSNQATPREASWQPLGDTPMHPEYPCAHCITSSAVGTVLQSIVGNDVGEISLTSLSVPGVTRKWTRIQDYMDEVSSARIYAGFHYRFSTKVGEDMGRKIGQRTVTTQLRGVEAAAQPQ